MNELTSRSERHRAAVESFLEGNEPKFMLNLYSSEIKRLENQYPILIAKGDYASETPNDKRHVCVIRRSLA